MGRGRTKPELKPVQISQLRQALSAARDAREAERLRLVLLAAKGRHTLAELARQAGRSRSTIQNWLEKHEAGGLKGLLERKSSPGSTSPVGSLEIQRQLRAGFRNGRWSSAAELAVWLKTCHGITRSRKSIYYWFKKLGRKTTQQ